MSNSKLNLEKLKNTLNDMEFKAKLEKITTVESLIEFLKSENMEYKTYECFKMISDIPRNSQKEKQISDFLKNFAEDRGYATYQDEFNNLIVYVDASEGMEEMESIMIQGHTDMVCVKERGYVHNFDEDSLKLYTENGMLRAKGTSLGGDDGIAVAYMMSIMDNKDIKHPKLECVFTSDEEGSFIGAENLDMSRLNSKTLLNIDSEEENVIIVSCAGGMAFENRIRFERVESKLENPNYYKIEISGLKGGHSGSDIHRKRANAIKLAGKALENLRKNDVAFELVSIKSGEAPNVIPSKAEIVIMIDENKLEKLKIELEKIKKDIKEEYKDTDSKINIELKEESSNINPIDNISKDRVIDWIKGFKNGVLTMSEDIEGLVESSDNVGTITTSKDEIIIINECRSCSDERISVIKNEMEELAKDTDIIMEVKYSYPGWAFNQESNARKSYNESVEKIYGKKADELAVHSGLEVGFFVEGVEGIDAISFGPNMIDIHTPEEKLDILSSLKIWYALIDFLEK